MAKTFPASETISPSVRLIEKDFSAYTPGFSLTKAALVGFCSKGPFDTPVLIRNRDELFTKFGWPNPDVGTFLIYAAIEYLRFGNRLYMVRVGVTDEGDENFAKTASVEIPSAGAQATIFIPSGEYAPVDGQTHYLRIRTNGQPFIRRFTLPGETMDVVDEDDSVDTVYTTLVSQLQKDDPFEITQVTDNSDASLNGIYIKTKVNGANAKIELVSTENDVYNSTFPGGLGVNTAATAAKVVGTNTVFPLGSSNTGTFDFTTYTDDAVLEVVVKGSGNTTIDGITQTITIPAGSYALSTGAESGDDPSTWGIVEYINYSSGRLGGFLARESGYLLERDGSTGAWQQSSSTDSGTLAVEGAGKLVLQTLHVGDDARISVRSDSTLDSVMGLSNIAKKGKTLDASDVTGVDAADFVAAGVYHGSAISSLNSFTVRASTPGLEGNNTKVVIAREADTGNFNISVFFHDLLVESFVRLNKDEDNPKNVRYLERWINDFSQYIVVDDNTLTEEGPLAGTYQLGASSAFVGSDGVPDDTDDQANLIIGDPMRSTGIYSLAEPEKIDIDLVAVPGVSTTSVIQALQDLCENQRADCMAIIDPPQSMPPWEVIAWHNGLHPLNHMKLDSSYLALYWPWVKIHDPINSEEIWMPPSGPVLGQIAFSEDVSHAWFAPAGLTRGRLGQVLELEYHAYLKERDTMYGYQNAVNTITSFPDTGVVIWGQKTLQRKMTALDRVNIRRLMFYIEKRIALNAKTLIFEPHDKILRERFTTMADTILGFVKINRGVHEYIIVCDETLNTDEVIDRNELRARIGVQPTKAAEFVFIEFTIHRKGSFEEAEPLK